jgi:DUF1680 family protein
VEMALVELYRETGTARYLDLAAFFCDQLPWQRWDRLWGHAVCALYFASGLTDIAIETGDNTRTDAVRRWWNELHTTSTYVTGAVGGRWTAEAVGEPYELPLARSSTETSERPTRSNKSCTTHCWPGCPLKVTSGSTPTRTP